MSTRNNINLKILIISLIANNILLANDNLTISGKIHNAFVNYDYKNDPISSSSSSKSRGHLDSKGYYLAPKLSIISPSWNNFISKVTVAGVTDFGINNHIYETGTFAFNSSNPKSYAILQEAYIRYEDNNNILSIGREEFDTPMISNDDYYILSNSFELLYYKNSSLENMIFSVGYFHRMAGVWDSGAYNTSKGGTSFYSMSEASYVPQIDKDNAGDKGIAYIAYEYDNETHNLKIWNYYAFDLYNTFFAQYNYLNSIDDFSYDLAIQFIDFSSVGKLNSGNTNIDYSIYSVNFAGTFENGFNFSTAISKFSDGEGQDYTLGAWGGYPYFAVGMIYTWWNIGSYRNATNYKIQTGYAFKDISGLSCNFQYLYIDSDSKYSKTLLNIGQSYQINYGASINYEAGNGIYLSARYEMADIEHEPKINAFLLFTGYKF